MVKKPINDNMINTSVERLFYTSTGQLIVSALFGLALALIFRRVCKDNCTVYYAPYIKDIENKKFKIEDTCYEYKPYSVKCDKTQKIYTSYNINKTPENKMDEPSIIDKFIK
jgi:hypothetical protein